MFDLAIPFFLPLWRRVAVVGVATLWGFFEFTTGQTFWGVIFVGMGALAVWKFWTANWSEVAKLDDD